MFRKSPALVTPQPVCEPPAQAPITVAADAVGHHAVPAHDPIGITQPGDIEGCVVEGIGDGVAVEVTRLPLRLRGRADDEDNGNGCQQFFEPLDIRFSPTTLERLGGKTASHTPPCNHQHKSSQRR